MNITAISVENLEEKGLDLLPNKMELKVRGNIFHMENALVDMTRPMTSLSHFLKEIKRQEILVILMSIKRNAVFMKNIERYLIENTAQKRRL